MVVDVRVTAVDVECLPDLPGFRFEIIDGELYVARQPTIGHQYISGEARGALRDWNRTTALGIVVFTPGLVLAPDQDVVPDLVWISHARRTVAEDERGHFRLAPELVVEVLSPGRANERRDVGPNWSCTPARA